MITCLLLVVCIPTYINYFYIFPTFYSFRDLFTTKFTLINIDLCVQMMTIIVNIGRLEELMRRNFGKFERLSPTNFAFFGYLVVEPGRNAATILRIAQFE